MTDLSEVLLFLIYKSPVSDSIGHILIKSQDYELHTTNSFS